MSNNTFLDQLNVKKLEEFARDVVPTLGCLMIQKSESHKREIGHTPFSLLPSPVPRHCFEQAAGLQRHFQALLYKISHDYHFLKNSLQKTIEADDFTGKLWEIYDTVHQEGLINPLSLSLMRMDYMFHTDHQNQTTSNNNNNTNISNTSNTSNSNNISNNNTSKTSNNNTSNNNSNNNNTQSPSNYHSISSHTHIKQVELNTIAASFAGLSQSLNQYYKLVVRNYMDPASVHQIPTNKASDGLAEGLTAAWKAYNNNKSIIVFLVDTNECNVFDQLLLELSVLKCDDKVKLVKVTHEYFRQHSSSDSERKLFLDDLEVAVVYFRTWYTPSSCQGSWQCRLMMERSKAIMCPSVGYQLAGTKKVQQMLCREGVLERWVDDDAVLKGMREVFAAQYSLDLEDPEAEIGIEMALKDPVKFVVKPQREGGGNNYYNEEVRTLLQKIRHSEERSGYILMERINPMVIMNVPMLASHVEEGDGDRFVAMVSELGIYGYLIGDKGKIVDNREVGYLLRTKEVGVNEGGVATGYSVLDSPFLVDSL